MKEEITKILSEFYDHIDWFNKNLKQPLEDDVEPTLDNFYKWLRFDL